MNIVLLPGYSFLYYSQHILYLCNPIVPRSSATTADKTTTSCHRLLLFYTRYVLTSLRWNSLERKKNNNTEWVPVETAAPQDRHLSPNYLQFVTYVLPLSVPSSVQVILDLVIETWLDVDMLYWRMKDICFQWFPFLFVVTVEYCCRKWPLTYSMLFLSPPFLQSCMACQNWQLVMLHENHGSLMRLHCEILQMTAVYLTCDTHVEILPR